LGISRYPYLVHLFTVNATGHGFVCGGSLVANDMVLTAAHCIQDRIAAKVQINRNEWRDTTVGEEINAKEFIFHPQWNKVTLGFDYALIVLERATTEDIKLIELNSDENFPAPGSAARVMGWGKTETGSLSDVALKVDVNVISKAECAAYWDGTPINAGKNLTIDDFHICTFEQGQGGCQGDSGEIELSFSFISQPKPRGSIISIKLVSGGPLIIPGASPEQDVQVGIVSFGTTYCIQAKSDVYARVSNQFDWIKKNLCSKSKSETSFDCSTKSAKAAKNAKKM
jgi:trypsin